MKELSVSQPTCLLILWLKFWKDIKLGKAILDFHLVGILLIFFPDQAKKES